MGLLLVLGLALLQALTGVLPSHRTDGWQDAARAPMVRAVSTPSDTEAVVRVPGSLFHALRTARVITSAPLDRHIASGTSGGSRALIPLAGARLAADRFALHGASQSGNASRVLASRGSLLPYYPTAPPVTG